MEGDDRFLNSDVPARSASEVYSFEALGHVGSDHFIGLEVFPNPGVHRVTMASDEVIAVCPVTGQPDHYRVIIIYNPDEHCLESKSLKLYFRQFHNMGIFCEALAVKIMQDVAQVLDIDQGQVNVVVAQKSRGGISIEANA